MPFWAAKEEVAKNGKNKLEKSASERNGETISLIYGHLLDGMKICRNDR